MYLDFLTYSYILPLGISTLFFFWLLLQYYFVDKPEEKGKKCFRYLSRHITKALHLNSENHKPLVFSCLYCPFWREKRLPVCPKRKKKKRQLGFVSFSPHQTEVILMSCTTTLSLLSFLSHLSISVSYPEGSTGSGVVGHTGRHPLHSCQLTLRTQEELRKCSC